VLFSSPSTGNLLSATLSSDSQDSEEDDNSSSSGTSSNNDLPSASLRGGGPSPSSSVPNLSESKTENGLTWEVDKRNNGMLAEGPRMTRANSLPYPASPTFGEVPPVEIPPPLVLTESKEMTAATLSALKNKLEALYVDLSLLRDFSSLNYTGISKILKKRDKLVADREPIMLPKIKQTYLRNKCGRASVFRDVDEVMSLEVRIQVGKRKIHPVGFGARNCQLTASPFFFFSLAPLQHLYAETFTNFNRLDAEISLGEVLARRMCAWFIFFFFGFEQSNLIFFLPPFIQPRYLPRIIVGLPRVFLSKCP
jgi:hypothetical protein